MTFPENSSWFPILENELAQPYFLTLQAKIEQAYRSTTPAVFPEQAHIFKAFELCPWEELRVVILGQDPYPTKGHANGLCFSVNEAVRPLPKSLVNIFKERKTDLALPDLQNGDLTHWAKQGVLLLNAVLTVEEGRPDSHKNWGWEHFTAAVIEKIATEKENVVFMLWGAKAQAKASRIDPAKHLILKAVHPSPLAAHRGFFGSKHFSKTNAFLSMLGKPEIQW
ncbi:MAG: uracil-DNA glycosylase [Flavobacteriales bacterium]